MAARERKPHVILHICNFSAAYRGGFLDMLTALQTYRDDVTNVFLFPARAASPQCQGWISQLCEQGQTAYVQTGSFWKNVGLLRRILKRHGVTHVMCHFPDVRIDMALRLVFPARRVTRFFHSLYVPNVRKLTHKLKCLIWWGNLFVGVSQAVCDELSRAHPRFRVVCLENAISFSRLDEVEDFERRGKLVLMLLGWNRRDKGADVALKAAARLQEQYGFVLQTVAADPRALSDFVEQTLGRRVDWVVPLAPTEHVGTYYRNADVFLSPSRSEAFGLAVIEAAYCECSLVLSRVGGQAQLSVDGAHFFTSEDVDELTEVLERAILEHGTPACRARRARTAEQVQQTYSLSDWVERVLALLP